MDIQQQVARSWSNVRKMLSDRRGPAPPALATSGVGDLEVAALAADLPTFAVDAGGGVAVVFHTAQQTVKKQDVFAAAGAGASHIVLVVNTRGSAGKLNNATVKSIQQEADSRGSTVEIWTLKETQYNVTEHELVPRHERVDPDDTDALLHRLCLKTRQLLPAISHTDPVARYLNLQVGEIVRITRPSPTAGAAVVYRVCKRI